MGSREFRSAAQEMMEAAAVLNYANTSWTAFPSPSWVT